MLPVALLAAWAALFASDVAPAARADSTPPSRMALRAFADTTKTEAVCDPGAIGRTCTIVGDDQFSVDVVATVPPGIGFNAYVANLAFDTGLTLDDQPDADENVWPQCDESNAAEAIGTNSYRLTCGTGGTQNFFYTGALLNLHFRCPGTGGSFQIDIIGGSGSPASRYLAAAVVSTYLLKSVDKGGTEVADAVVIECLADTDDDGIADVVEKTYPCMDQTVADAHLDGDSDGLSNIVELTITGTEPCNADTDGDGLEDGEEVNGVVSPDGLGTFFTDPLLADTDQDGCDDGRELGPDQALGGRRDPTNFWDLFDTPNPNAVPQRNAAVNIFDLVAISIRFGSSGNPTIDPLSTPPKTGYHPAFDRTQLGPNPWNLGPANGAINIFDLVFMSLQLSHNCV